MIPSTTPSDNLPDWLHWLESCLSTNTWAIQHLDKLEHGAVVFTPQQTAGRGQHDRVWYAPPGVLTMSVILDRIPALHLPTFSLLAGLAVIYAVEDLVPSLQNQLQLKWTNDILLNRRKLAGILCEGVTSHAADGTKLVVGIGLNRCADFSQVSELVGNPISLHEVSLVPEALSLLQRIRHYLLQTAGLMQSSQRSLAALLPILRSRDALFGHTITIMLPNQQLTGEAAGIDDRGCLLLRLNDGTIHTISSGHVVW